MSAYARSALYRRPTATTSHQKPSRYDNRAMTKGRGLMPHIQAETAPNNDCDFEIEDSHVNGTFQLSQQSFTEIDLNGDPPTESDIKFGRHSSIQGNMSNNHQGHVNFQISHTKATPFSQLSQLSCQTEDFSQLNQQLTTNQQHHNLQQQTQQQQTPNPQHTHRIVSPVPNMTPGISPKNNSSSLMTPKQSFFPQTNNNTIQHHHNQRSLPPPGSLLRQPKQHQHQQSSLLTTPKDNNELTPTTGNQQNTNEDRSLVSTTFNKKNRPWMLSACMDVYNRSRNRKALQPRKPLNRTRDFNAGRNRSVSAVVRGVFGSTSDVGSIISERAASRKSRRSIDDDVGSIISERAASRQSRRSTDDDVGSNISERAASRQSRRSTDDVGDKRKNRRSDGDVETTRRKVEWTTTMEGDDECIVPESAPDVQNSSESQELSKEQRQPPSGEKPMGDNHSRGSGDFEHSDETFVTSSSGNDDKHQQTFPLTQDTGTGESSCGAHSSSAASARRDTASKATMMSDVGVQVNVESSSEEERALVLAKQNELEAQLQDQQKRIDEQHRITESFITQMKQMEDNIKSKIERLSSFDDKIENAIKKIAAREEEMQQRSLVLIRQEQDKMTSLSNDFQTTLERSRETLSNEIQQKVMPTMTTAVRDMVKEMVNTAQTKLIHSAETILKKRSLELDDERSACLSRGRREKRQKHSLGLMSLSNTGTVSNKCRTIEIERRDDASNRSLNTKNATQLQQQQMLVEGAMSDIGVQANVESSSRMDEQLMTHRQIKTAASKTPQKRALQSSQSSSQNGNKDESNLLNVLASVCKKQKKNEPLLQAPSSSIGKDDEIISPTKKKKKKDEIIMADVPKEVLVMPESQVEEGLEMPPELLDGPENMKNPTKSAARSEKVHGKNRKNSKSVKTRTRKPASSSMDPTTRVATKEMQNKMDPPPRVNQQQQKTTSRKRRDNSASSRTDTAVASKKPASSMATKKMQNKIDPTTEKHSTREMMQTTPERKSTKQAKMTNFVVNRSTVSEVTNNLPIVVTSNPKKRAHKKVTTTTTAKPSDKSNSVVVTETTENKMTTKKSSSSSPPQKPPTTQKRKRDIQSKQQATTTTTKTPPLRRSKRLKQAQLDAMSAAGESFTRRSSKEASSSAVKSINNDNKEPFQKKIKSVTTTNTTTAAAAAATTQPKKKTTFNVPEETPNKQQEQKQKPSGNTRYGLGYNTKSKMDISRTFKSIYSAISDTMSFTSFSTSKKRRDRRVVDPFDYSSRVAADVLPNKKTSSVADNAVAATNHPSANRAMEPTNAVAATVDNNKKRNCMLGGNNSGSSREKKKTSNGDRKQQRGTYRKRRRIVIPGKDEIRV